MTMGRPLVDLTGKTFGDMTVLGKADGRDSHGRVTWRLRCSCGAERTVRGDSLRRLMPPKCSYRCRQQLAQVAEDLGLAPASVTSSTGRDTLPG